MPRARGDGARREKPTGQLARFADARKANNDLLTDIERHLLYEATLPEDRRQDVIHPSEMAKAGWCPRATFLRIWIARSGKLPPREANRFQLENIFEEGHEYHRKWQARLQRMGRLRGRWHCLACETTWEDVSPPGCVICGAPQKALEYREVALADPEHLIYGSADGEVTPAEEDEDGETVLIEVKSIGEGTVRIEMPAVLMKYTIEREDERGRTYKVVDQHQVWKDINRPFSPHLRQGLIYLRLRAKRKDLPPLRKIVFIYEYKPTSAVKTFVVTRDDDLVQELWDQAADIVYGLETGKEPRCARPGECEDCATYEKLESNNDGDRAESGAAQGEPARRRRAREGSSGHPEEAAGRAPRPRRRPDRSRGRRPDGSADQVHEVGGLLRSTARARRHR